MSSTPTRPSVVQPWRHFWEQSEREDPHERPRLFGRYVGIFCVHIFFLFFFVDDAFLSIEGKKSAQKKVQISPTKKLEEEEEEEKDVFVVALRRRRAKKKKVSLLYPPRRRRSVVFCVGSTTAPKRRRRDGGVVVESETMRSLCDDDDDEIRLRF